MQQRLGSAFRLLFALWVRRQRSKDGRRHCRCDRRLESAAWAAYAEPLEDRILLAATNQSQNNGNVPGALPADALTALDAYLAEPDPAYTYSLDSTISGTGYTDYVINMISQTWRSSSEVNNTVWQHWLHIIVPTNLSRTTAILDIEGGNNSANPPTTAPALDVAMATATGAITVEVPQIPNEPLTFLDDGVSRREDSIIAYTFDKFLDGGDNDWPLLLPMVKSAVKAMDTAQSFVSTQSNGSVSIDKFIVTGDSKRGWTTWLTPAVDSRVAAIIPFVFDDLDQALEVVHHQDTYVGVTQDILGGFSTAVQDYTNFNIFGRIDTPQGMALGKIVDPYVYLNRPAYNVPKYMIDSTGDQFFVSDSAQFYIDQLPGTDYLRYVPNTDHGLNTDAFNKAINFAVALLDGAALPQYSWTVSNGGATITLDTQTAPTSVNMWEAVNPSSRDFRLETFGANWVSTPLSDAGHPGTFIASVNPPATGAIAFMIEMNFTVDGLPLTFTTQVSEVPMLRPTVVVSDAGGVYNGSPYAATATATGVSGSAVGGSFALTYYAGNSASGPGTTTPPTAAGTYTVVADFTSANPSYTGGQSDPLTFTISPATPTVTASDAGGTFDGNPFAATASATGIGGASVPGSFAFTYYVGSTVNGTGSPDAPIDVGTYTVVADFTSADPNYSNGRSDPVTFSIAGAHNATTTMLASSGNPAIPNEPLTFTATVALVGAVGTPTGNVTFFDGATPLATVALVGGAAAFDTDSLLLGTHTITAHYAGDSNSDPSDSDPLAEVVQTVAYGPDPFAPGQMAIGVGGTPGDDAITVVPGSKRNTVVITVDESNLDHYHFSGTFSIANLDRIFVLEGHGTNTITLGALRIPDAVFGGNGTDTFVLVGSLAAGSTIDGGGGFDNVVGRNVSQTWNLTGANSGNVGNVAFTNVQNVTGGASADTFKFASGASVSGTINGGSGTDLVTGANIANDWLLAGVNAGNLNGTAFANIEKLKGGSGVDVFQFADGTSLTGTIDGGSGSDWLDYALYTSSIAVNLGNGTAAHAGGISSIENVRGGSADDTLTGGSAAGALLGGAGNDTLTGGSKRNLLFGGGGADHIAGGTNNDIVIGGTTDYDTNFAALAAILAEWQSGNSYAVRISNIRTGSGLSGGFQLVAGSTVHDDGVADTLTGRGALDWFFRDFNDQISDLQSGEVIN